MHEIDTLRATTNFACLTVDTKTTLCDTNRWSGIATYLHHGSDQGAINNYEMRRVDETPLQHMPAITNHLVLMAS